MARRTAGDLIRRIQELPPETRAEVSDFVDFLRLRRDRALRDALGRLAAPAFERVWDNSADAEYDRL